MPGLLQLQAQYLHHSLWVQQRTQRTDRHSIMQAYRASFLGQVLPGCSRPQRSACPSLPRRQQVAVRAQGDYASGSFEGERPQVRAAASDLLLAE